MLQQKAMVERGYCLARGGEVNAKGLTAYNDT